MLTIDRIQNLNPPMPTVWLFSECLEARGKQDLWTQKKPETLAALREQAMIQSTESSNRIEGVTVSPDRLRPILLGKSAPRDRSEEELVGYRKALNWIYTRKRAEEIRPGVILRLHKTAQGGFSGDAGTWKTRDNEIIEVLPTGERRVRFKTTPAKNVEAMIGRLCTSYNELAQTDRIPALLPIATFVFDFLCVHPFRDGNGRVSRLLTALLLQNHGFAVSRYVSLERMIEESKEEYYSALGRCSAAWHEGKNEILPWINYLLGVVRRAYVEFERRVESSDESGKFELVRQTILRQMDPFTLAEIKAQCPSVSEQLIKLVLSDLKKSKKVSLNGRGRGAKWTLLS